MAEMRAFPKTLRSIDLDQELRIIAIGKAIYGFRTGMQCAEMLDRAGHSYGEEAAEAIRREYRRQRACGERRAVTTVRLRKNAPAGPFDWMATFTGHGMGDPVGTGRTEFDAIMNLFSQQEEMAHARV